MHTLIPRLVAAIASGVVTYLAQLLERSLGIAVSEDERAAMLSVLITVGLTAYSVIHREISKRINPDDHAAG